MTPDILFIILSLCAVLLCGILIALVSILLQKKNTGEGGALRLMQSELQNMRSVMDTKLNDANQNVSKHLHNNLRHNTQVSENSQKNLEALAKKLTELSETNREIKAIGDRLEGLEHILKNPKRRGNLGEYFLSELLENVFTQEQFALHHPLSSGFVDAALFIGDKTIPIDAKFPQENYQKILESEDELSIKKYSSDLKKDIKKRIDETAKYILPEEKTTDFAFMLIPAEGMYYDIFISKIGDVSSRELIEYGFSKKVIICSPSSFYAYLQTVLQGMKSLQIEEQAKEIQKYVVKLQKDLEQYEEVFHKLGSSINTSVNHYNNANKRLRIIDKDVIKIAPEAENILGKFEDIDHTHQ